MMPNGFMPNAKEQVANSINTIQNAIVSLEESMRGTEKAENKERIQSAITSLYEAGERLSSYQD